jgi:hypothetical protein
VRHRLIFGWDNALGAYAFQSEEAGDTLMPIHIFTEGNADQLVIHTDGHVSYNTNIVSLSANTTLNATHKNKIVECNGTFTVTLPNSMPIGYKVDLINVGAGIITIAASGTLQSKGGNTKLSSQYGGASAYHRGSNVWILVGDLSA